MTDFFDLDSDALERITALRFYCLGADPSRGDDEQYVAAVRAEIAEIERAISAIGPLKTIGIGGAGDDFVRVAVLAGALYHVLKLPGAAHEAATHLRDVWIRIRRGRLTTWRVTRESLVLECCEQLRNDLGVDFVPDCNSIKVERFLLHEHSLNYIPDAEFLITIPHAPLNCTYVFRADTEFNVSRLATLPGLPHGAGKKPA